MSNYTKTTDFEAKDSLPSGDSGKIIRGSEFETEFDNIATAIASKSDANNPTFTGTVTIDGLTVNGNTVLGNAASDTVTVTADIASNLLPSADDTYNLGAVGAEWNDLFIDGTANIDSLVADTADINGGTVDGVTSVSLSSGNLTLPDNSKAIFGAGSDLQIYHDGNNSRIVDAGTGDLYIQANDQLRITNANATETMAVFNEDGAVSLRYNGTEKIATTNTGIDVAGVITTDGMTTSADINFGDNDKAVFGAGSDLQIYHDGSNSRIKDNGTGGLYVQGSSFISLTNASATETYVYAAENGAVQLKYDNATKLATTSTGIDVTGTVTADGLDVSTATGSSSPTPSKITIATTSAGSDWSTTNPWGSLAFYSADTSSGGAKEQVTLDTVAFNSSGGISDFRINTYNSGLKERLRVSYNGDISFLEDTGTTAKFFWDASAESLGIGVGTPQASLHIANDASRTQFIASGTVGNDRFLAIDVDITGNEDVAYITVDQADALAFGEKTNDNDRSIANEHMRIDASGNVGIGTSSPASILSVQRNGTVVSSGLDSQTAATFQSTGAAGSSTHVNILAGSTGSSGQAVLTFGDADDPDIGRITYRNGDNSMAFTTNTSERMRISSAGSVAIGHASNTSANSKLQVTGSGITTSDNITALANKNSRYFGVSQVDQEVTMMYLSASATNNTLILGGGTSLAEPASVVKFHTGTIGTKSSGTERARIDSSGNLVVGTTSTSVSNDGARLLADGQARFTISDTTALYLNRNGTNGTIAEFRKDNAVVGVIGSYLDDRLFVGTGDTNLNFHATADTVYPSGANGTTRDGAIDLGASFSRFKDLYLSGGAFLGGTTAANKLDDYEEGTWTPVYVSSGGSFATMAMDVQSATYTKIGNLVTINCFIRTDDVDITGASGSVKIDGLPFSAASQASTHSNYATGWDTDGNPSGGYISGSSVFLQKRTDINNPTNSVAIGDLSNGTVANANQLILSATYRTTA